MLRRLIKGLTTNVSHTREGATDSALRTRYFPVPRSRVVEAIERMAGERGRWHSHEQTETSGRLQIHLTHTTRLMRFVDDVYVTLVSDGDRTQVDVTSQSRVGKGDLGQNRRNIRDLLNYLDASIDEA